MNDYSKLAGAFMQHRPQNGGIVPPHMQQQRPMQQPMGGMGRPPMQRPMPQGVPGAGGIMDGQPRPQMGGMQPQRPNLGFGPAPRPLGGGIMGGQPQQPRPFDGGMGRPMQSPQTGPGFGPSNPPRPLGGGIMGGQPQAPRPMNQPMNPPMGRRPY